jgi:hypothetical protein
METWLSFMEWAKEFKTRSMTVRPFFRPAGRFSGRQAVFPAGRPFFRPAGRFSGRQAV